MPNLPPPPVPQKLQEMLKDYPELIQELQDTLDSYVKKPNPLQPFDGAIWLLEDTLSSFISEARDELKAAEAGADAQAISQAETKKLLMFRARSGSAGGGLLDLNELKVYFDANSRAFE
ncbi:hypothetical protein [Rhodanobacter sp. MP1X3]|uniref:hypothetical protein n=1 Tax=Rhodanobacter sp. MP1X3 TaxID=2723086 RepID=UPI0017F3AA2F|nr:hypothetical protein [Rhodanobacter sp. MP1X3]MBB6244934.1 hypothetical protein [Rhodanobacter sp. MP1X3]